MLSGGINYGNYVLHANPTEVVRADSGRTKLTTLTLEPDI